MKKLILLLIIASAFASGIKAQNAKHMPITYATNPPQQGCICGEVHPMGFVYQTASFFIPIESGSSTPNYAPPEPDTINYIAIYRDTTKDANGQIIYPVVLTSKIAGFKTQGSLSTFLNERVDSTNLTAIYDVRTKKPLKASFTVEEKVVERVVAERQRNRKWRVQ